MKPITRIIVVICLSLLICSCQDKNTSTEDEASRDTPVTLTTDKDKVSYIIGTQMAVSLTNNKGIKDQINPDILEKGFDDKLANRPLLIAGEEANTILRDFNRKMQGIAKTTSTPPTNEQLKSVEPLPNAEAVSTSPINSKDFLSGNPINNGVTTLYKEYMIGFCCEASKQNWDRLQELQKDNFVRLLVK